MHDSLFVHPKICQVIHSIAFRAERADSEIIEKTFYDDHTIDYLCTPNSQVFSGRRGTGKTHLLKILHNRLQSKDNCVVFIDCRTLCSGINYQEDPVLVARQMFGELLKIVKQSIRNTADEKSSQNYTNTHAIDDIDCDKLYKHTPEKLKFQKNSTELDEYSLTANCALKKSFVFPSIQFAKHRHNNRQRNEEYTYAISESVNTSAIFNAFNEELIKYKINTYILVDEWSSIPENVQPYFAHLLKKTLYPCSRIVFKIAMLEARSKFSDSSQQIGIELGSELTYELDLDDKYIFDINPKDTTNYCVNVLYNQLCGNLPDSYLRQRCHCVSLSDFIAMAFEEEQALFLLIKSCFGNARDLLCIFNRCVLRAKQHNKKITINNVLLSVQEWFKYDKLSNLNHHHHDFYNTLSSWVVESQKSRVFCIEEISYKKSTVLNLVDMRLLHIVKKNVAIPDFPNKRFVVISMDYGEIAELLRSGILILAFASDQYEKNLAEKIPNAQTNFFPPSEYFKLDHRRIRNVIIDIQEEKPILKLS